MATSTAKAKKNKSVFSHLYVQVLIAIFVGISLGHFYPETGVAMKPFGEGFIKLIKMLVGPIIFCTVVTGIASMDDMKSAGRVGVKALGYFMVVSAFCLLLGMVVANVVQPGVGMNVDPATLSTDAVSNVVGDKGKIDSFSGFVLHIIPNTLVGAFTEGEVLQVLLIALLFAAAATVLGAKAQPVVKLIDQTSHFLFTIVGFVMKLAPLGAFGAMAFSIGQYGVATLIPLAELLLCFYATCIVFVFVVLAVILSFTGLSLWKFLGYIKEEIFIVFGTCSSETVFPRMIDKLTALGCDRSVVGMVLPTGYSFNLTGSAIYLTMASIFLAQATNTPMSLEQQALLLAVMMIASKGTAGVVGSAFVVLSATLASIGHIPVASLALILGIDRFMSEGRSVTNLISNGVATIFVAHWENALDVEKAKAILSGKKEAKLETGEE